MDAREEARWLSRLTLHRRALHRIPEPGNGEHETGAYLRHVLEGLAPDELDAFAGTGLRAVFLSKAPKARTLAFRADMDALPIEEPEGCPFRSLHPGWMHACGHDGHMANLLALAEWISENRASLPASVLLLFQPAEETTGGARRMIEDGALRNPDADAVYGMHMMPDVPIGRIALRPGPVMASTCEWDFILTGKSAHGAAPHEGRDTIAAAAHLMTLLQTTVARSVDPCREALITIGRIEGGVQRNVIAERTVLSGICRTFSNAVYDALEQRVQAVCRGTAEAFGLSVEMNKGVFYPCTENDPQETARLIPLLGGAYLPAKPKMTAEDFSYYQLAKPGVFAFCGCMDDRHAAPLHSPDFGFDERALLAGFSLFRRIIESEGSGIDGHL